VLSFKWSNLAANNAGVTCVIIGLASKASKKPCRIFDGNIVRDVSMISPYLTVGAPVYVAARSEPLSDISEMLLGNFAKDGGHLLLTSGDFYEFKKNSKRFIRPIYGANEFINGIQRYCLWINDDEVVEASLLDEIKIRLNRVVEFREKSRKKATTFWSKLPHRL